MDVGGGVELGDRVAHMIMSWRWSMKISSSLVAFLPHVYIE